MLTAVCRTQCARIGGCSVSNSASVGANSSERERAPHAGVSHTGVPFLRTVLTADLLLDIQRDTLTITAIKWDEYF